MVNFWTFELKRSWLVQRLARLTRNQWMPIRRKSETQQIGKTDLIYTLSHFY